MSACSTNEAARRVGITGAALSNYIKAGKVPRPRTVQVGKVKLHAWTESDIERLRKLLPKIANGRKTRYQKKHLAVSKQQSAKTQKKRTKKKKKKKLN